MRRQNLLAQSRAGDLCRHVIQVMDERLKAFMATIAEENRSPSTTAEKHQRAAVRSKLIRDLEVKLLNGDLISQLDRDINEKLLEMEQSAARRIEHNLEARLERMRQWEQSDEPTRRILSVFPTLHEMLPLGDYRDGYAHQQALRSRGLVLAALAGMTHVGAPPSKEEGT